MTADDFLKKLAKDGGYIVGTDQCSGIEIAEARTKGRMYVDDNHLGYIIRYKKNWEMLKAAFAYCYQGNPHKPTLDEFNK